MQCLKGGNFVDKEILKNLGLLVLFAVCWVLTDYLFQV